MVGRQEPVNLHEVARVAGELLDERRQPEERHEPDQDAGFALPSGDRPAPPRAARDLAGRDVRGGRRGAGGEAMAARPNNLRNGAATTRTTTSTIVLRSVWPGKRQQTAAAMVGHQGSRLATTSAMRRTSRATGRATVYGAQMVPRRSSPKDHW